MGESTAMSKRGREETEEADNVSYSSLAHGQGSEELSETPPRSISNGVTSNDDETDPFEKIADEFLFGANEQIMAAGIENVKTTGRLLIDCLTHIAMVLTQCEMAMLRNETKRCHLQPLLSDVHKLIKAAMLLVERQFEHLGVALDQTSGNTTTSAESQSVQHYKAPVLKKLDQKFQTFINEGVLDQFSSVLTDYLKDGSSLRTAMMDLTVVFKTSHASYDPFTKQGECFKKTVLDFYQEMKEPIQYVQAYCRPLASEETV